MGGAAGAGDDDLETSFGGACRIVIKARRRPVCGDDAGLEGDAERLQHLGGVAHRGPVRLAAHDDADEGGVPAHAVASIKAARPAGAEESAPFRGGVVAWQAGRAEG